MISAPGHDSTLKEKTWSICSVFVISAVKKLKINMPRDLFDLKDPFGSWNVYLYKYCNHPK